MKEFTGELSPTNKQFFDLFLKIKKVHPIAVLTGSLSLIFQDYIPIRDVGDIDISVPYWKDLSIPAEKIYFNSTDSGYSGDNTCIGNIKVTGVRSGHSRRPTEVGHVFIDHRSGYEMVKVNGVLIKCATPMQSMIAKLKYLEHGDAQKHGMDLIYYIAKKANLAGTIVLQHPVIAAASGEDFFNLLSES